MTLILSEEDIEQVLRVEDCVRVLEETFQDFGLGHAVSRPRTHTYTYLEPDTFYNFKSMDGAVPRYGVHALRISSEVVQAQEHFGRAGRRRSLCRPGDAVRHPDHRAARYHAGGRHPAHACR